MDNRQINVNFMVTLKKDKAVACSTWLQPPLELADESPKKNWAQLLQRETARKVTFTRCCEISTASPLTSSLTDSTR